MAGFNFGWGARVPSVSRINARRLRGNRNDLIARGLSNLLVVEPATALRVSSRGHEPKIKPAQGQFDFWLGRTGSLGVAHKCATPAGQP